MSNLVLSIICLLFPLALSVQAVPPENPVRAGEVFTIPIMISQDQPEAWPPRIRPVFNPPAGLQVLGISAETGAGTGDLLKYAIKIRAVEAGKYELAGVGAYYLDPVSGEEKELRAETINLEVRPEGPFGIGLKWISLLVLLVLAGIGLAVWLLFGREKKVEPVPADSRNGEWFGTVLEEIRRHRIRGEEIPCLAIIIEAEKAFPDPDREYIGELENKIEHLKYGGERVSSSELGEIYRRTELKIKKMMDPQTDGPSDFAKASSFAKASEDKSLDRADQQKESHK